ncbi:peptidoglycan recognition family protein [Streptomyces sp. NPDC005202]|uniref:N-acetylmuramoyl-L-alanine amidase n=1 Tax=Streptomyces sp. NPDC005202 TaxID=3157021 RepID=UPI0033A4E403
MEHSLVTRRWLLRGAVCAAGGAAAALALPKMLSAATRVETRSGQPPHDVARGRAGAGAAGRPLVDYPSARWLPADASNYTFAARPETDPVEYVVIHLTTDTFSDMVSTFQDPEGSVSAHYLVRAADGLVVQCVREADIAWHAGNWEYNTRSIGIEHEGWMEQSSYSDVMYRASARLTAAICAKHEIPVDREHILGHIEIPDSVHEDPGPNWNWDRYMALVSSAGKPRSTTALTPQPR